MENNPSIAANKKSNVIRFLPHIARLLLGILFFLSGLMGFFMKEPPKETMSPGMWEFLQAMIHSGYLFYLTKATETIAGILLISNRYVPLALIILAPIIVNIALVNYFLAPSGLTIAVIIICLEIYLVRVYRKTFSPILKAKNLTE
jgi:uncharacterized membrane protein YphA (DoxX/SURF4 family)